MRRYILTSLKLGILGAIILGLIPIIASLLAGIGNMVADSYPQMAKTVYHMAQVTALPGTQEDAIRYDMARLAYREKRYIESQSILSSLQTTDISFERLHNLGNTHYRLGQLAKNEQEVILEWNKALAAYSGALEIQKDPETQANYDFVKKKLEQYVSQEATKKPEDSALQDTGSGSDSSSSGSGSKTTDAGSGSDSSKSTSTGAQDQSGSGNTAPGTWSNSGKFSMTGGSIGSTGGLSERQKQEIESYLQELKKDASDNRKFFRSEPTPSQNGLSDMIRNFFGDDPFFSDSLGNNGKKDW